MIKKDLLFIPGYYQIFIINTEQYKLINEINIQESGIIFGVCVLNKNMVLTGDNNKTIKQWKIEGNNLMLVSKKENAHNDCIYALLNLGNGMIASCSEDKTIKIW